MSQRKMASPTLRSCCWSGVKATARTGSEWPIYTWGQWESDTESFEAQRGRHGPPLHTARERRILQVWLLSPRTPQTGGVRRRLSGVSGSSKHRGAGGITHLAAGAGLCWVVPHLDGPVSGHQQEAGIPAEGQGGAGHRGDTWQLQEMFLSVTEDRKSQTAAQGKSPFSRNAPLEEQQVAQGRPLLDALQALKLEPRGKGRSSG